jgi:hypothetical protein
MKIINIFIHTLQAVTLAALSCQQPPLSPRHSLVSMSIKTTQGLALHMTKQVQCRKDCNFLFLPSLRQTFGSVVSSKPAQRALRTAFLSSFPVNQEVKIN